MSEQKPVETKKTKKPLLKLKELRNTSQLKNAAGGGGAVTSQCHHTQMTCNGCGSINC